MRAKLDGLLELKNQKRFLENLEEETKIAENFLDYWNKVLVGTSQVDYSVSDKEIAYGSNAYARIVNTPDGKAIEIITRKPDKKFDRMGKNELFDFMNNCLK